MSLSFDLVRGGLRRAGRALRWLPLALAAGSSAGCHAGENLGAAIGEGLGEALFEGECKTDSECGEGLHCVTELVPIGGGQCRPGCASDRECGPGQACAIPFLSSIGECVDSCRGDQDCAAGERCAVAFVGSVNECVAVGTSSGASSEGADQGAGGTSWGSITAGDFCQLRDDGTCEALMGGVLCCPLRGRRYDAELACVAAGEAAPATLACGARADTDGATCAYTGEPACYERSREDGSSEVLLIEDGAAAEVLVAPLTPCAAPPAGDTPACEP